MLIGLDGFPLTSLRTGVGHYTFELARALASIAPFHQFELIAPALFTDSTVKDLSHNCPPNLTAVSLRPSLIRRRWWTVGLPLYVKQAALDLFHGTNYEVPLWSKRRSVVTIHDLSVLLDPEKHEAHLARRARRRLPVMARSAGMIITPTESVKREVCERLRVKPGRIAVTPYAARGAFQPANSDRIAETKRRLGIKDDFILFVGTIEPRKNLLTLGRAFEQILSHTSHRPQLIIAGSEGWLMEEFHRFIKMSDVGDHVRFTGYLADDDLCALYSSCKIFVYPSFYEGFGLPPLEAMSCGAPVVASSIPAILETLGSAARFVDPMDVEALTKSLIELLENENERNRLSSVGLKHAAKFSWEKTASLTLRVFHELLGEPPTRS